tara:strand:+ start:3771 stop:4421 length:651 start_codon:yes stop_codon:yes gene_type:complete
MENPQNNYRYERKYIINDVMMYEVYKKLYLNNFSEIFKKRKINNVYFDDSELNSFKENVDGQSERRKYRVRWYGDKFIKSDKIYEIKIKSEDVNKKLTYNLGKITFTEPMVSSILTISNDVNQKTFDKFRKQFLIPVLYNNYSRRYFYNKNLDFRVTIDQNLVSTSLINYRSYQSNDIIVEIKYQKENLFQMKDLFNLQVSKNSKYVTGIQSTMWM